MSGDATGRRNSPVDPATKTRALQLAAQVGDRHASLQTGVPETTIRSWRRRAALKAERESKPETQPVSPPARTDADDDAIVQTRRVMQKARDVAEDAIDRLQQIIPSAKSPQSTAISAGILLDKVSILACELRALDQHRAAISDENVQALVMLVRMFVEALGLEDDDVFRAVLAELLRSFGQDGVAAVSPATAATARSVLHRKVREQIEPTLREEIEGELRPRIEQELRERAVGRPAPLELPAAGQTGEADPGSLGLPRQRYVTVSVDDDVDDGGAVDDVEVVDGEPTGVVVRPSSGGGMRPVRRRDPWKGRYSGSDFG